MALLLSEGNMVVECCLSWPILAKDAWLLLRQHIRMKQAKLEIILADLEKEDRIIRTISKQVN